MRFLILTALSGCGLLGGLTRTTLDADATTALLKQEGWEVVCDAAPVRKQDGVPGFTKPVHEQACVARKGDVQAHVDLASDGEVQQQIGYPRTVDVAASRALLAELFPAGQEPALPFAQAVAATDDEADQREASRRCTEIVERLAARGWALEEGESCAENGVLTGHVYLDRGDRRLYLDVDPADPPRATGAGWSHVERGGFAAGASGARGVMPVEVYAVSEQAVPEATLKDWRMAAEDAREMGETVDEVLPTAMVGIRLEVQGLSSMDACTLSRRLSGLEGPCKDGPMP